MRVVQLREDIRAVYLRDGEGVFNRREQEREMGVVELGRKGRWGID